MAFSWLHSRACILLASVHRLRQAQTPPPWQTRLHLHLAVLSLALVVVLGEGSFRWSYAAVAPSGENLALASGARQYTDRGEMVAPAAPLIFTSTSYVNILPALSQAAPPLAPALREPEPRLLPAFYDETYRIGADEPLSAVASRYGISVESLIWANGLQNGDILMIGQELRIPRLSGIAYTVQEGDTLDSIGQRFDVPAELIVEFRANRLTLDSSLEVGQEMFIPGGNMPLPEALLARYGGIQDMGNITAQPAGIVRQQRTNMRAGPDTQYETVGQFMAGQQARLLARHGEWLKVEVGDTAGWMHADVLEIGGGLIETLPISNDIPPLPPTWTWPTYGAFTSGFGPRWGSFHYGIDIANGAGTPIVAARAGRVIASGWCSGYGYCVKLSHDGGMTTIYGHMLDQPSVSVGQTVKVGQLIGRMGSTYDARGGGYSTGVHLHFEVKVNGRAVNPLSFLP